MWWKSTCIFWQTPFPLYLNRSSTLFHSSMSTRPALPKSPTFPDADPPVLQNFYWLPSCPPCTTAGIILCLQCAPPLSGIKKWHLCRKVLFLHQYHPWCPYYILGCSRPNCFPVLNISTHSYLSLAHFTLFWHNFPAWPYFFCFSAACFAWAIFADIMPASISLGIIILDPRGLITIPRAGQILPLGSLRRIMAA